MKSVLESRVATPRLRGCALSTSYHTNQQANCSVYSIAALLRDEPCSGIISQKPGMRIRYQQPECFDLTAIER